MARETILTTIRIYGQIGPGKRIAFSKLAVEHFEKFNRPFRLAIDVSIWHFQIQSGKGGSNPALRTLYYRLLRLLVLGIQPLFVFDGANKPPFKRNARTGTQSASLPNYLTKQLLKLFGFPFHTAPGEAEAECALLQKEGIVDAVLSEDVDTLMFGCTMTLRNWSSEGTRGSKTPTHVTYYGPEDTGIEEARLDSEGMVLVALMSGGDYIPAGVPRCGIKVACEAARAGFGRDLCRLSKDDVVGFRQWRERLNYELETNESKLFRVKHKALKIPENFPDMAVLGYYTSPAVSSSDKLRRLSSEISWNGEVDVLGLQKFVAEAFEWHYLSGAHKFVRGLAPALLVRRLCASANPSASSSDMNEKSTIIAICGRRVHFDSDGKSELRLTYIPAKIVGLDLELEEKEGSVENCGESESDLPEQLESAKEASSRSREGTKLPYDPTQPERVWILEAYARVGVPKMVEAWEETMRNPKKGATRNARKKQEPAKTQGRIDSFLKVSKPASAQPQEYGASKQIDSTQLGLRSQAFLLGRDSTAQNDAGAGKSGRHKNDKRAVQSPKTPRKSGLPSPAASAEKNPWTLSKRPSDTFNVELPRGSRYSALGIYGTAPGVEKHSSHSGGDATPTELPLTPSSSSSSSQAKRKKQPSNPYSTSNPNSETIILSSSPPETCHHRLSPRGRPAESPPTSSPPTHQIKNISKKRTPTPYLATSPPPEYSPTSSLLPSPSILLLSSSLSSPSASSTQKNLASENISPLLQSPPPMLAPAPAPAQPKLSTPNNNNNKKSKKTKRKTLVKLRESLDGAWRTAERWEAGGRYNAKRGVVYENVEVLDLTYT